MIREMKLYVLLLVVVQCIDCGVAKASFGNSSIDRAVFEFIRDNVENGATVLELGSGWATSQLAKHYSMISIEHDQKWLGKYDSDYIYAPIVGKWYDPEAIKHGLIGKKYAAILVDGPPGYNPQQMGRYGFLMNLDLFDTNTLIIVDDIQRPQERKLLEDISKQLGRPYQIIRGKKLAAVIFPGD